MNIPEELKKYKQWVVWKAVKNDKGKITKPPYSVKSGQRASIQNPAHWVDFETAVKAMPYYDGIGFVLTENDPFCCIDFDNHGGKCVLEKHELGAKHFKSFCEVSPSGNGLHVWLKGSVPSGREIRGIGGVYSKDRYITITGNTFIDAPIQTANGSLTKLWESGSKPIAPQVAPKPKVNTNALSDNDLLSRAYNAINADKFKRLYYGDWQGYYPSASESDYALVDCIAYYTQDDEQVARIFLNSPAGSRDKYKTNPQHHLWNRMIPRCRDKQIVQPVIDFTALNESFKQREAAMKVPPEPPKQKREIFSEFPKGLVGEIAQFVYDNSPKPVREISLAASLAYVSGICGRSFNVNTSGLNTYIVLIADSGTGKDSVHKGLARLCKEVEKTGVQAEQFVGPAMIASQQGIIKAITNSSTKSFYSILSEFGGTLHRICSPKANSNETQLYDFLLGMYGKSDKDGELGATAYSDSMKNMPKVQSPSFSFIGDTTPSAFYSALNEKAVMDGLIPRCTIIEYTGDFSVAKEDMEYVEPTTDLIVSLSELMAQSLSLNNSNAKVNVEFSPEARTLFREYERHLTDEMNRLKKDNEHIQYTLLNRGPLKARKLAGIVAVGQNKIYPVVTKEIAEWGIEFTKKEIQNIATRFKQKNYGNMTDQSFNNMTSLINKWIHSWIDMSEDQVLKKYGKCPAAYRKANVVPLSYISAKCGNTARLEILKGSIDMLVRSGYIFRLTDDDVRKIKEGAGITSLNPKQAEVFAVDQSFFDKLNGEGE